MLQPGFAGSTGLPGHDFSYFFINLARVNPPGRAGFQNYVYVNSKTLI
jgi:hypothetical protein